GVGAGVGSGEVERRGHRLSVAAAAQITVRPTPGETYPRSMTTADTSSDLAPIADRADAPASLPTLTAGGLTWRPAAPGDAAALLELRNTIAEADAEPYRETIEELTELFQAPWRRFDTDSLVGVDGE